MTSSPDTEHREAQPIDPEPAPHNERDQGGCCGGPAPKGAHACCALDADVKSSGGRGCGCGPRCRATASAKVDCC
jgi:hypothetical protein